MPDLPDLDTRIRDLVARAVADAPAPPEIGTPRPDRRSHPTPDHRRWWIGGTAGPARRGRRRRHVRARRERHRDRDDTGDRAHDRRRPGAGAGHDRAGDHAVPPTTSVSGPPPFEVTQPDVVATAGPAGLATVSLTLGLECRWPDVPVDIGLAVGDGRVVVLPTGAAAPQVWTCDGPPSELFAVADGQVVLHDVAIVGDQPVLLYSVQRDWDDPRRRQRGPLRRRPRRRIRPDRTGTDRRMGVGHAAIAPGPHRAHRR